MRWLKSHFWCIKSRSKKGLDRNLRRAKIPDMTSHTHTKPGCPAGLAEAARAAIQGPRREAQNRLTEASKYAETKVLADLKKFITVKASEGGHAEILEHVQANAAELARACGVSETVWHEGIEKLLAYISTSVTELEVLATFVRAKSGVSDDAKVSLEVVEYLNAHSAPLVKAFGGLDGEAVVARLKACARHEGLPDIAERARWRIETLNGLLAKRLLDTVKDRSEKLREERKGSALETAQAAADELSANVRLDYAYGQHEMHVPIAQILKLALTSGKSDLFEFRWSMLPNEVIRIPQSTLRQIKALRKKDLEAWVTAKGLHVRWNGRRGGLNLRPYEARVTVEPTVALVAPSLRAHDACPGGRRHSQMGPSIS